MPKKQKMLRAKQLAAKYEEEKKQRLKKKKEQYETSTNRAIEQRTKKEDCETSTNREIERSASLSRRELRWRQQQFLEYRSLLVAAELKLLEVEVAAELKLLEAGDIATELKLVTLTRTRSWSSVEAGYHPRVSQPGQCHEGK